VRASSLRGSLSPFYCFSPPRQCTRNKQTRNSQVPLKLTVNSVAEMVTVNAGIDSIAAESAPSGGFLEERSAQSLVSNTYIENFTSPIADFGEIVQIVPGTFTTSANGVGLGQSKTYFRGFQDGDYNIDFDGIPFYDTNTPTHHSWAFFPSQWIGGVDFDRSPGTASTIGPTPFGGSIHLLSKPLSSEQDVRGTASYGTWNTKLYDGAYNSGSFGLFGSPKKSNLFVDVHHMTSDGYQSFNYNLRNAGSLLYQYQFSPKTVLTGFAGVVQLNSNGPNISFHALHALRRVGHQRLQLRKPHRHREQYRDAGDGQRASSLYRRRRQVPV
jgi:iron complex outermembrane receptor protein